MDKMDVLWVSGNEGANVELAVGTILSPTYAKVCKVNSSLLSLL